jgi:hypothetical protein
LPDHLNQITHLLAGLIIISYKYGGLELDELLFFNIISFEPIYIMHNSLHINELDAGHQVTKRVKKCVMASEQNEVIELAVGSAKGSKLKCHDNIVKLVRIPDKMLHQHLFECQLMLKSSVD